LERAAWGTEKREFMLDERERIADERERSLMNAN
jgi:hypothetical protein